MDGKAAFEIWIEDDRLQSGPDGLAFGADGRLYVNTFMAGELFAIAMDDERAGEITRITTPRPLVFPDALKADGDGFLMVRVAGPCPGQDLGQEGNDDADRGVQRAVGSSALWRFGLGLGRPDCQPA